MGAENRFDKLGADLSELDLAWRDRLTDAKSLFAAGRNSMSIAMGIYALEILLKVRICQRLNLKSLPKPFEIHDLGGLLILSGLSEAIIDVDVRPVRANWDKIKKTAENLNVLRYKPDDAKSHEEAEQFLAQLEDPENGVISWLTKSP